MTENPSLADRVGLGTRQGLASSWPLIERLWTGVVAMSGWRRVGLAVFLGALATLALPPIYAVPVLIPAFVGLLWLLEGTTGWRAALITGAWFGFGYFTAGLYWVANALLTRPAEFGWFAPIAPMGLSLILLPFIAVAVMVTRVTTRPGVGRVLAFGAMWTVFEWLRSWLFTGFPWNLIGTVWTFSDAMMQGAAWAGVYSLSLVTVIAASMPAVLPGARAVRRWPWTAVAGALAVLGLIWAGGMVRLSQAGPVAPTVPGVNLRLVQPSIDQAVKWRPDLLDEHLLEQARMGAMPGLLEPTHVIWSEVSAPMFLLEDPQRLAVVGRMTPKGGVTIVGTLRRTPAGTPFQIWNTLAAIDDMGKVVAVYDKSHLVPFGEYMPFRDVLGIANFTIGFADFSAGPGLTTLRLPGLPPVGPLICYEIIFPGDVVNREDRPQWLLNITNDGWYGVSSGPYQHLAAARFRAVEEGLPVVRVANTGISAIIDPYGRIVNELGLGATGIVEGHLPQALASPPPYGRYGNVPILLLTAVIFLLGVTVARRA